MKKMIDTELIERAKENSKIIFNIDYSWREYVEKREQYGVRLPFDGDYTCKIKDLWFFVEGYRGEMIIDKVCDGRKTYQIIKPVQVKEFTVYGMFDNTGRFSCFVSEPVVGFHYLGMNGRGVIPICTG